MTKLVILTFVLKIFDTVWFVILLLIWFDLIWVLVFWCGLLVWFGSYCVDLIYLLVCLCVVFVLIWCCLRTDLLARALGWPFTLDCLFVVLNFAVMLTFWFSFVCFMLGLEF